MIASRYSVERDARPSVFRERFADSPKWFHGTRVTPPVCTQNFGRALGRLPMVGLTAELRNAALR